MCVQPWSQSRGRRRTQVGPAKPGHNLGLFASKTTHHQKSQRPKCSACVQAVLSLLPSVNSQRSVADSSNHRLCPEVCYKTFPLLANFCQITNNQFQLQPPLSQNRPLPTPQSQNTQQRPKRYIPTAPISPNVSLNSSNNSPSFGTN
jgi:hypothetical protein